MRKLKTSKGSDRKDVIVACEEALAFMHCEGLPEQKELPANNPIECYCKTAKAEPKPDKPRRQIRDTLSDDEPADPRPARPIAKGKGKSKRERPRSASPSRKRNGRDDLDVDEPPKAKRPKRMGRRKSTGSSLTKKAVAEKPSKKAGSSKREKTKVKTEQPPSDPEIDAVESVHDKPLPGPGRRLDNRARDMDVDRVNEEEKKTEDVPEEEDDAQDDAAAMEIELASSESAQRRIPELNSRYVDKIAGMEDPDVDHLLKKAPLVNVNRVQPNADDNVSVEIAQQVCGTVVNGAAEYLKELHEVVRKRDELQEELYRLGRLREALVGGIRALDAKHFPMSMLIETGIGKKLVKTMDKLQPHCATATSELVGVLKKWADRANQMDEESGVESGNEGGDDTPVKTEPRREEMAVEEEEEVLDEDEKNGGDRDAKKGAKSGARKDAAREGALREEKDASDISTLSRKMTPSDSGRKSSKSVASPGTPKKRSASDKDREVARVAKDKTRDKEHGAKDKGGEREPGGEKSSKTEEAEEAPSKITRPASARSLAKSVASPSRAKARWEKFDKATAVKTLEVSLNAYLDVYPVEGVDKAGLAEIVERAIAAKRGDSGKKYFEECREVVFRIMAASDGKTAEGKRTLEFVKSRDPAHILDGD